MSSTRTHCPYCALNCGLELEVRDERVVGFNPWKASPLTRGTLCGKGKTAFEQVHHDDRLTKPLIRVDNGFREATWDEALDLAASGFERIRSEHGSQANAVLSGGSLTNETSYLIGKFARLALGTPNVDYSGRLCMAAASAAHTMAFGLDRMMTPLDELRRAEVAVVIGTHISAAFPVTLPTLLNHVRKRGGKVIVVDPRAGRFVQKGDLHIAPEPGTDAVFFNGVLRELVRQDLIDREFVESRTTGFSQAVHAAMEFDPDRVKEIADVPATLLERAANLIGSTDKCMFLHGRGVEQQANGTENVLSIINVGLACGHVGRPGAGINMLSGQRNGQGAREWGQRCDQLPAGRSITDADDRKVVAQRWGVDEQSLPGTGATYVEILAGAESSTTRGLLTIGTNMAVSAPDLGAVHAQLESLEHHVVIDPFFSSSAIYADVVLPGTTFAEQSGTITTLEGRVVRVDQAVQPQTGWTDRDILGALAERLGAQRWFSHSSTVEVFDEMRKVSAGGPADYSGMSLDRIRSEGGLFWPCPTPDHPGTPQLHIDRFSHPDGKARFHPVSGSQPGHDPVAGYPLILTTGRLLAQFLSANQTGRIETQQQLAPGPYIEINPTTARAYGLRRDRLVTVTSRQGTVTVPWRPKRGIRYDTLFMPYHWPECNLLVSAELDPISKIPGLKHTPVRVSASDLRDGQLATLSNGGGATTPAPIALETDSS